MIQSTIAMTKYNTFVRTAIPVSGEPTDQYIGQIDCITRFTPLAGLL